MKAVAPDPGPVGDSALLWWCLCWGHSSVRPQQGPGVEGATDTHSRVSPSCEGTLECWWAFLTSQGSACILLFVTALAAGIRGLRFSVNQPVWGVQVEARMFTEKKAAIHACTWWTREYTENANTCQMVCH